MARNAKLKGSLRFRDSEPDPRTEHTQKSSESLNAMRTEPIRELSPFKRAKMGAGDVFLAPEIVLNLWVVN